MNKYFLTFHVLFIVINLSIVLSCKNTYQPREEVTINIQEFKQDSTSIRAIQVFDENTVYFAGADASFGFTKDAGKTWTKKSILYEDSIKPIFRSIATNGKDLFVLSIENPALLYKISNTNTELVYTENHSKVFYDSMAFFDVNNGIAIGDPTENCLSIIMTNDAGNSWHKIDCDKLPKVVEGEAAFAASNTNIKIIDDTVWIATGGNKARVFKSNDKGKTWQVFDTPIIQGKESQGIYSIDFSDKKHGIIIGGDYSKPFDNQKNSAITSDGGTTWQLVAKGLDPNYRSCVQYVPNTNGQEVFAVGKMGISFSNDAGHTWKKISDADYYTIQFIDRNTAWLGGHNKVGLMAF